MVVPGEYPTTGSNVDELAKKSKGEGRLANLEPDWVPTSNLPRRADEAATPNEEIFPEPPKRSELDTPAKGGDHSAEDATGKEHVGEARTSFPAKGHLMI